jgi:phage shock protein PspC (stress-responsive transcriptional regulator)
MKGIIHVSIAGIAFRLEDEAYTRLSDYLGRIEKSYGHSADGQEILTDIEARIAEIFLSHQDASVVVSLPLIESTLQQLGAPEDFSEEEQEFRSENAAPSRGSAGRIAHRLYRNPEGARLGGVCNGLATYFSMDPTLVRLLFVAPLLLMILFYIFGITHWGNTMVGFMTTAFILYPLLWIVIPKARTPLQKLEMQGEKVTRESLEQSFRDELHTRANTPQNIVTRAKNERSASVFAEILSIVGRVLLFGLKAMVFLIGGLLILSLISAILGIFMVPFFTPWPESFFVPNGDILLVLILAALIIPVALAIFGILKLLFGFKKGGTFAGTLGVVWLLVVLFGTVIFIKEFNNIRINEKTIREWRTEGKDLEEILEDAWDEDVDLHGTNHLTRFSSFGNRKRTTEWNVLETASDTLTVAPRLPAEVPDDFLLILRDGNPKRYPEPTLAIRKSYRASGEEKKNRYFDRLTVKHELHRDTLAGRDSLLLEVHIPSLRRVSEMRLNGELFVPENMTVIVAPGIRVSDRRERSNSFVEPLNTEQNHGNH